MKVLFFKFKENNINKFITFSLAFSLAIMIGISITDLIPESTYKLLLNYGIEKGIIYSLITFILGIITIKYLHQLMNKTEQKNDLYKLGILNMLALILHNFPEGIATFMSSYKDTELGIKLAIAIAFHNIPEGITVALPVYFATGSKGKAMYYTFLSSISEPIGALMAFLVLRPFINDVTLGIIFGIISGIMLYIAIEELLPSSRDYGYPRLALWAAFAGICLMPLTLMF